MLPIVKTPIERPTIQIPVVEESPAVLPSSAQQQENGAPAVAPATTTVFVKECGLCAPRSGKEVWTANAPDRPEDEDAWVSFLETSVHASCLEQAIAERLILNIGVVERNSQAKTGVDEHRDFATRCFEPQDKLPMICVIDGTVPVFRADTDAFVKQYGQMEVPVVALQPFATGFRLFPEIAPPRTLEDLLQCTSKLNKNGRLAESSAPLDLRTSFPEYFAEMTKSIPLFALPGGPCDILTKDSRNILRASAPKLTILSPGSVLRAQRSKFRGASLLLTPGSVIEWGALNFEDAEKVLEASKSQRSREDPNWVPDLAFCVRHGARVHCGQQTQPGQMMLSFPGSIYWGFVHGSASTHIAQWSFAERSRLAFEYVLSDALCANHPEELLELDESGAREDVLTLRLFYEILRADEERTSLLPKDLAEAMVSRLIKYCQEVPVDAGRTSSIPDDHARKVRCDQCRSELFERKIYCSECESEGQNHENIVELIATHPPRSSAKKDRSTLPDWLRVGCRVLVNLTVSGNSNDKPPRVVGAAHLPAIILKTGHGFFTVHLEGAGEQAVKRKAAIEPHPLGPQLAMGYSVRIKPEGGGGGDPVIQTTPFKQCVLCVECFTKSHPKRKHAKRNVSYLDGRCDFLKTIEAWQKEIQARSTFRKDDLCVWHSAVKDLVIPVEDPLPAAAIMIKTVSNEAGRDAMQQAAIMGPSPYHYPAAATSPSSSAVAPKATQSLIAASGMERRSRQAAKRRLFGNEVIHSERAMWTRRDELNASTSSAVSKLSSQNMKRQRTSSASATFGMNQSSWDSTVENDMYSNGTMEAHLHHVGIPLPGSHHGMNLALQSGSFFVGGRKSLSILLEADAIMHAHAELLDANKPEELRALWARARREVPLKKIWKFMSMDATSPSSPAEASSEGADMLERKLSRREAIHALAESAANAEPAPEVA